MTKNDIKRLLISLKKFLTLKVEMNGVLEGELNKKAKKSDNILSKSKLY